MWNSKNQLEIVANYIPELALAKPESFGICVVTTQGQVFEMGDCDKLVKLEEQ
ncbi:glutaminase [Nostoc sp.]|uniref:glutaminase n=1 Tax=Nostoc sp. TaxID=1180 RepID=UPI002FF91728